MARFRRTTAKKNTYLQYVRSYRNELKQPATEVIANLGNISNMSEDNIESLTLSFIKAVKMQDKFQLNHFRAGKGYHYGTCLPVIAIWHKLGLDEIINNSLSKKVTIPVSKISLIQTSNRFSDPGSKLACYRWQSLSMFSQIKNFISLPEDEQEKLHTYYRSLEYLCEAKEKIEEELYYQLKSYGMDNRLVLYDITSVYFEGSQSEIGKKGYSRDKRPDAEQIVIGLVMSRDGIPIAHHVFEGNRPDKTTVEEVIEDLRERFSITEIVFVGDRGMLTVENIDTVKSKGNNYILGMHKRNRRIIKFLLERIDKKVECQEIRYADLSEGFKKEYNEKLRFIVCYNIQMAELNKNSRERNIRKFENLIKETKLKGELDKIKESHYKLKSFLSKYHITKFYKLTIEKTTKDKTTQSKEKRDDYGKKEEHNIQIEKIDSAILAEANLDGRFFIQTEVSSQEFNKEEIVKSYKSLQKVEQAFKVIKNEFDIRPVYLRKDNRIRGHVMICYLALLINILLDKKMQEVFPEMENAQARKVNLKKSEHNEDDPLTMKTLMEELDTIRLIPLYINGSESPKYISTQIGRNLKKLFSSLGIINAMEPQKLRLATKGKTTNYNQLELLFT